jgi:L-asparaginase II
MHPIPLVVCTRGTAENPGAFVENTHFGSIAVVDRSGKLLAYAGDPNFMTFSRSTIKAFQATPFVNDGGVDELGISAQELALMCSSHNGEAFHVAAVNSLLTKAQATVEQLQCGAHAPLLYSMTAAKAPTGSVWNACHNNCSGKHAGMLAWCTLHGAVKESYLDLGHPLQQAIRRSLSIWCDTAEADFQTGIDGCSAPNYALPLKNLALGYARLADAKSGATAKQLFEVMTTYPEYVSGTDRHDMAFMKTAPADWVAKIGADGVQLIGCRSAGIGIAVKITDGNQRAVISASIETLKQMGLLDVTLNNPQAPLASWENLSIKNVRGTVIGQVKPVFSLTRY